METPEHDGSGVVSAMTDRRYCQIALGGELAHLRSDHVEMLALAN